MSTDTEDQVVDTASAVDDGDQQETDTRQFVTFTIGEESFAVDMMPVQEIIRMPEVVRVPLAPPALDGLANLRGKVLPIISLRRLFGMPERDADEATSGSSHSSGTVEKLKTAQMKAAEACSELMTRLASSMRTASLAPSTRVAPNTTRHTDKPNVNVIHHSMWGIAVVLMGCHHAPLARHILCLRHGERTQLARFPAHARLTRAPRTGGGAFHVLGRAVTAYRGGDTSAPH